MEKTVYNCEICSFKLTTKPNLARHIYYRHCKKRPLYCPVCGVTGKSVNNLINHGASIHSKEIIPLMCSERQMSTIDEKKCIQMSDFDCVYCGLIFQSTSELADHQTKHQSERPFICPICNRMFQEYGQAVVHGIAIHSQEIVPKTTAEQKRPDLMVDQIESPKKFNMKKVTILDDEEASKNRKSKLKQQRKEERDEQIQNEDSEDSDCENKKRRDRSVNGRFKCEFCGLIKTSMANLKSHYLVHSNEKNFYCEICGRAFKHYYNVITHSKKFHSKEVVPRPILAEQRKYLEKNFMINISDPDYKNKQTPTPGPVSPSESTFASHAFTSQPSTQSKTSEATSESFNQLTLPTLDYENKKMSLFGDVCETQFHYADFTEIGNYRTENTLNGEIEIYLDVQPLFDPNYNPLYVSN